MKRLLLALLATVALVASAAPNFDYKPADNVVFYLGGDERGLMEFYADECPMVDPSWKLAKFFHLGVTMSGGQIEPFCWARVDADDIGLLLPDGASLAVPARALTRGPAPLPRAMNEVGV